MTRTNSDQENIQTTNQIGGFPPFSSLGVYASWLVDVTSSLDALILGAAAILSRALGHSSVIPVVGFPLGLNAGTRVLAAQHNGIRGGESDHMTRL